MYETSTFLFLLPWLIIQKLDRLANEIIFPFGTIFPLISAIITPLNGIATDKFKVGLPALYSLKPMTFGHEDELRFRSILQ